MRISLLSKRLSRPFVTFLHGPSATRRSRPYQAWRAGPRRPLGLFQSQSQSPRSSEEVLVRFEMPQYGYLGQNLREVQSNFGSRKTSEQPHIPTRPTTTPATVQA